MELLSDKDMRHAYVFDKSRYNNIIKDFKTYSKKLSTIIKEPFDKVKFLETIEEFSRENQIVQGSLSIVKGIKYVLDLTKKYETKIEVGHYKLFKNFKPVLDFYLKVDSTVKNFNYFRKECRENPTLITNFNIDHLEIYSTEATESEKNFMYFAVTSQPDIEYLKMDRMVLCWTKDLMKFICNKYATN